ncbi:MAG: RHS repeat domain-containing protein [Putridiphycobacter sp.]
MTYYPQDTPMKIVKHHFSKGLEKKYSIQKNAIDYYPFGMLLPNRHEDAGEYRYGFNGMEKDDEVKGEGNSYTTLFRQYDPRVGRWLSLDPLESKFPGQSPYVAFDNNPIYFSDPNGAESKDPETIGSKSEKVANGIIQRHGSAFGIGDDIGNGSFSLTEEEKKDIYTFDDDGNVTGFTAIGHQVNKIIQEQAYLEKRNVDWANIISDVYNQEGISNKTLEELSKFRSELVKQTKALYMTQIFSADIVGEIFVIWSPGKFVNKASSKYFKPRGAPVLRRAYIMSVKNLSGMAKSLLKQGFSKEMTARIVSAQRRYLGRLYKDATPPQMLEKIYKRNLKHYGDKYGPTIKYFRKQGKTWDDIIESASKPGGGDLNF